MGIRYFTAFFLLTLAGIPCAAQQGTSPMVGGYATGFAPATKTVFSDDFTGYQDLTFPGKKWNGSSGKIVNTVMVNAESTKMNIFVFAGGKDKTVTPIIPENAVNGRYVTFETDFQLLDTEATFFVNFPDARGGEHIFAFGKKWLHIYGDGGNTPGERFIITMDARRFKAAQWHCLAMSFSETTLNIYMDNYHLFGFGNDSTKNLQGAYYNMYFGYVPATFEISGKGAVALKHARFAQSNEVQKGLKVQIAQFNKILTGEKFVTHDILFDVNKAVIKSESEEYLSALAAWLKQNRTIKLEIAGHTDSDGDEAANMILSQKRADAIVNKLISSGIAENRLKGVGYGESKPVKPNDTEAGKAANRRVEFQKI